MPLTNRRILVLEEDYLIALEIGRMLAEAGVGCVQVARDPKLPERPDLGGFDAAIMEIRVFEAPTLDFAKGILAAGVPIVIGTAFDEFKDGVPGLPGVPVLLKPYDSKELVATVLGAIGSGPSPSKQ